MFSEATTISYNRWQLTDNWLMDSGATWHMTSEREWFHQYQPISRVSVFMGDDLALDIASIGTIKINMYDGTFRTIQKVCHVVGLKKCFLSLGQLDNLGCKTHIENGNMKIVKGALVVMKAEKITTNLYMLKGETLEEAQVVVTSEKTREETTML